MVDAYRDTTAIVNDRNGIAFIDDDADGVAVACQGLVHGVIHDLIYQMMESPARGTADIHAWSFTNCFQSLQNLNLICSIFCRLLFCTHNYLLLCGKASKSSTGASLSFFYSSVYDLKYPVQLELIFYKIINSCTGDQGLYVFYAFQQIMLPVSVQFGKDIIQQKNRAVLDFFSDQLNFCQLQ